jgi:tRNA A37 threonylcarbamoyltransferase TsaD
MSAVGDLTVLGIETSCDETAAAVVVREGAGRGRVVSNVVRAQWEQHRPYGGVVPELAARAHVECLDEIIGTAMKDAGASFADLDGIAVTAGPGLIGGLMVGVVTAETIARVHGTPLIAVNHLEAHALTVGLTEGLSPPYLLLLVSGGHTRVPTPVSALPLMMRWARPSTRPQNCLASVRLADPPLNTQQGKVIRAGLICRDPCMVAPNRTSRSPV